MIKLKIDGHDDREKIITGLANSGYKVWVKEENPPIHRHRTIHYVCIDDPRDLRKLKTLARVLFSVILFSDISMTRNLFSDILKMLFDEISEQFGTPACEMLDLDTLKELRERNKDEHNILARDIDNIIKNLEKQHAQGS